MNSILTNFDFFIEYDINPFLIFDDKGKIKYANRSADLIIQTSISQQLYEMALTYASKTYGSNKTVIDINILTYEFYCINVIYENPMEIGMYLYYKPLRKKYEKASFQDFNKTDINILLKANIELFKITCNAKIQLLTDVDIPKFLAHQNNIALLVKKVFNKFKNSKNINITLKIKPSEKIIIQNTKYKIATLIIYGDSLVREGNHEEIKDLTEENYINIQNEENSIALEFPLIQ